MNGRPVLPGLFEIHVEEVPTFDPLLISGRTPATVQTSAMAAVSVEDSKDTQRQAVYDAIREAGPTGHTDDELQVLLGLDGSSERPRRWELEKLSLIESVPGLHRVTRTNRRAVVWVVKGAHG